MLAGERPGMLHILLWTACTPQQRSSQSKVSIVLFYQTRLKMYCEYDLMHLPEARFAISFQ